MARHRQYRTVESIARKSSEYFFYVDRDPDAMPTLKGLAWYLGYSKLNDIGRRLPDRRGKSFKRLFEALRNEINTRQAQRLTANENAN